MGENDDVGESGDKNVGSLDDDDGRYPGPGPGLGPGGYAGKRLVVIGRAGWALGTKDGARASTRSRRVTRGEFRSAGCSRAGARDPKTGSGIVTVRVGVGAGMCSCCEHGRGRSSHSGGDEEGFGGEKWRGGKGKGKRVLRRNRPGWTTRPGA